MAFKSTTPKQRDRLDSYIDLWRAGRTTFVGPDPESGLMLVLHAEPRIRLVYYIDRQGGTVDPKVAGFPDPSIWRKLAGE